jgi:putative SOS response-associated peptidase YedK
VTIVLVALTIAGTHRECTCTVPEWGIYITQNPDIVVDYQDNDQVPNDVQCTWGDWAPWSACDCNAMTMESARQATNADCSQAYDSRSGSERSRCAVHIVT